MPTEAILCGNKAYPNAVVETQIEDQYNSKLDLMRYVTVSHELEDTPGLTKKVRRYRATPDKTEVLAEGEGNSEFITTDYDEYEYKVILLQNTFKYTDEKAMEDPKVVETGVKNAAVDMFNKTNSLCMAEFIKTKHEVVAPNGKFDFDAFVDATAAFPDVAVEQNENGDKDLVIFGLVHKNNKAEIRKNLKDDLIQVEAYTRKGYIGTVNGVHLYVSAIATEGTIIIATKEAVKCEVKTRVQVEYDRDKDRRTNKVISRKYGVFYLENENYCLRLVKEATAAGDSETGDETPAANGDETPESTSGEEVAQG